MKKNQSTMDWLAELEKDISLLMQTSGLDRDSCYYLLNPDEDSDVNRVVKKHLRTEEQRLWMAENDISLEELFRGRYEETEAIALKVEEMFTEWNQKLGRDLFG